MKKLDQAQPVFVVQGENSPRRSARYQEPRMGPIGMLKMHHAMAFGNDAVAVAQRRDSPIMAYVGHNGSGKTQAMMLDALPTLEGIEWHCEVPDHAHTKRGEYSGLRHVLSTVQITLPNGSPHPLYIPFDSWDRLTGFEHGDLLMDEMASVAHSRNSSALPQAIQTLMQQYRKVDIRVCWTAPDWMRSDKLVRETTLAVTLCSGSMGVRTGTNLWKSNRRFRYVTFDAATFDEFNAHQATSTASRSRPDVIVKQWFWASGHPVRQHFNTLQSVIMLGATSDAGICARCGGSRRRPECSCVDYIDRKEQRKAITGDKRRAGDRDQATPTFAESSGSGDTSENRDGVHAQKGARDPEHQLVAVGADVEHAHSHGWEGDDGNCTCVAPSDQTSSVIV